MAYYHNIYSFRPDVITATFLEEEMRKRGWDIRVSGNMAEGESATLSGWPSNYERAQQLSRDYPEMTSQIRTWLQCYGVPIVNDTIYNLRINHSYPDQCDHMQGRSYSEAYSRVEWEYSLLGAGHPTRSDVSSKFTRDLNETLQTWGYCLAVDRDDGLFQIIDESGVRLRDVFDPDEERLYAELEPEPQDTIDYMAEVRRFYTQHLEPRIGAPLGASQEEVDALEARIKMRLPLAYKQYLRWMGKNSMGPWWSRKGTEIDIVVGHNNSFWWHLNHSSPAFGGVGRFVFFQDPESNQEAWFQIPKQGENPVVYYQGDLSQAPHPTVCFSQFVMKWLELDVPWLPKVEN